MQPWFPGSWQTKACQQEINYPCIADLNNRVATLSQSPPLVTPEKCDWLRERLCEASCGESFFIQAGDCAESFAGATPEVIMQKLAFLNELAEILQNSLQKPIVTIGRIAGQYAKPRTELFELIAGQLIPNYRGDLIHSAELSDRGRHPDPERLLRGYDFARQSLEILNKSPIAVSHEALNLFYEQALTREISPGKWYNLSTHFPWVGVKTSLLTGAHLEYLRGIQNPIAVKIGPTMTPAWLQSLLELLNPERIPGKLCLLTRLGIAQVEKRLPMLIETVKNAEIPVVWACDPMHGNTRQTEIGMKTRYIRDILQEWFITRDVHQTQGTVLAGLHLELTHENVTECIGAPSEYDEGGLAENYRSLVDPRLNRDQALALMRSIRGAGP